MVNLFTHAGEDDDADVDANAQSDYDGGAL